MINKFLLAYLCIGISTVLCAKDSDNAEQKDTKDKRQIGVYQTAINPHQQPSTRVDTVYGPHPNQFLIQTIGQPLQDLQQRQSHKSLQQPEQTAEVSQQYALVQEVQPTHAEKPNKSPRKYQLGKSAVQFPPERQQQQFVQHFHQPIQQYQLLSPQDELLKFFQDEIAVRALSVPNPKRQPNKPVQHEKSGPGLGNYREAPVRQENQEVVAYIQENVPQQYYAQFPIDYHKSIPNHPLAASSLEKELEKLVASNKPHQHQQQHVQQNLQPTLYKSPKLQEQAAATFTATAAPVPPTASQEKFLSFFPDFAQLSGFRPNGEIYFNEQLQEQPKAYPTETVEQEQKPRKISSANNQYLTEKQKFKTNHQIFHQKQAQLYHAQQKEQQNYLRAQHESRNAAMKIIEAPSLNYEKPQPSAAPLISYYKAESTERPETAIPIQHKISQAQPSTSAIFVSQGTGIHPTVQPSQPIKSYQHEKSSQLPQLPPLDGKPLTPEEFQALVDAGYPVQAVPVPVPVPYDTYVKQSQPQIPHDHPRSQRRQARPPQKQSITYLHPIRLQQQEQERGYAPST